jgi:hypothetical protein
MKFLLGMMVCTRYVNDCIAENALFAEFVLDSLKRHANCDWGEISESDKVENDFSLDKHLRLFSVYKKDKFVIWVITEADRSVTTILFPSEY